MMMTTKIMIRLLPVTWDLSNTNKSKYNGEHHSELAYHIRENKIKTARIQN